MYSTRENTQKCDVTMLVIYKGKCSEKSTVHYSLPTHDKCYNTTTICTSVVSM